MHRASLGPALVHDAHFGIGPCATLCIRPHEARHGEWMPDAKVRRKSSQTSVP
jgi:hypothetical protein